MGFEHAQDAAGFVVGALATGALEPFGEEARARLLNWLRREGETESDLAARLSALEADLNNIKLQKALRAEIVKLAKRNADFETRLIEHAATDRINIRASGKSRITFINYARPQKNVSSEDDLSDEAYEDSAAHGIDKSQQAGEIDKSDYFIEALNFYARLWVRLRLDWPSSSTGRQIVLVIVGVLLLLSALLMALVFSLPWIAYRISSKWYAALFVGIMELSLLSVIFSSPELIETKSAAPPVICKYQNLLGGDDAERAIKISKSSQFEFQIETSEGTIIVDPDFDNAPCEALALRESIKAGFYKAKNCNKIDYGVIQCFPSKPKYRDRSFRVYREDGSSDAGSDLEDGSVLLETDVLDGSTSGLLSFATGASSIYLSGSLVIGSIVKGKSILHKTVDEGWSSNLFAADDLNKPLRLLKFSVIDSPSAASPSITAS